MNSAWESWDWDTVHREIDSLRLSDVIGLAEAAVRVRFGEPDDVVSPGTESADASGTVLFRADEDLCYYRLLPHTCFSISVSGGRVVTMSYGQSGSDVRPSRTACWGHGTRRRSVEKRSNRPLERAGMSARRPGQRSSAGRSAPSR